MNGHNSLEESDASVMHLCPVCLRKLQSNAGFDVLERYQALHAWYSKHGLEEEEAWVANRLRRLKSLDVAVPKQAKAQSKKDQTKETERERKKSEESTK
jgi:hypothetical protein